MSEHQDLSSAIAALQSALIHDAEYRDTWKANIACAIMDTVQREGETDHAWRNRCANTFINYLTAGHSDDPISNADLPGALSVEMAASGVTSTHN